MVFALQKYGFWRAKTTFLAYKNHLFDLQKVGFCIFVKYISIFIDINKEYEKTYNKFIKMVYNSLKRQSCHCVLYILYDVRLNKQCLHKYRNIVCTILCSLTNCFKL